MFPKEFAWLRRGSFGDCDGRRGNGVGVLSFSSVVRQWSNFSLLQRPSDTSEVRIKFQYKWKLMSLSWFYLLDDFLIVGRENSKWMFIWALRVCYTFIFWSYISCNCPPTAEAIVIPSFWSSKLSNYRVILPFGQLGLDSYLFQWEETKDALGYLFSIKGHLISIWIQRPIFVMILKKFPKVILKYEIRRNCLKDNEILQNLLEKW